MAAGDDWLGIQVGRAGSCRAGRERRAAAAVSARSCSASCAPGQGSTIATGYLLQLAEPWARVSLDDENVRAALAGKIAELALDAVIVGPITRSGMNEAGTLQHVRDYLDLFAEVPTVRPARHVHAWSTTRTAAGQVSGAWEGAVDTLFHVQARGTGRRG